MFLLVSVVSMAKFYSWSWRGLGSQWFMVLRNLIGYLIKNKYPWKCTQKQQKWTQKVVFMYLCMYDCLYIKQSKKKRVGGHGRSQRKGIWEGLEGERGKEEVCN